jgi:hypothetical protein
MLFYDGRPVARTSPQVLAAVNRLSQRLHLELQEHAVQSVPEAVQILAKARTAIDGIFLICSAVFRGVRPLSQAAMQRRLPIFS